MNNLITEIKQILESDYTPSHLYAFAFNQKKGKIGKIEFTAKIPYSLPESFLEYYDWLSSLEITSDDLGEELSDIIYETENKQNTMSEIISNTIEWEGIKKEQPDREWLEGFVEISSWDSAYVRVIDTLGKINNKPGTIAQYDFKGGGVYNIMYKDFDAYLATTSDLLKQKLFFPEVNGEINEEEFLYGELNKKREALIKELNKGVIDYIDWQ